MIKLFNVLLLMIPMGIYSTQAYASPIYSGNGVFRNTSLMLDWLVNESDQVYVESILFDTGPLPPNPCQVDVTGLQECKMTILVDRIPVKTLSKADSRGFTAAEVDSFFNQTGVIGTASSDAKDICFMLTAISRSVTSFSYIPRFCNVPGNGIPPSNAVVPPHCTATASNIEHGSLEASAVNGHEASNLIEVQCDKEASITVTSRGYNPETGLRLNGNGNLHSLIKVNDFSADKEVHGTANLTTSFNVSSVLTTPSVSELYGDYSGNIVFTIDYQ